MSPVRLKACNNDMSLGCAHRASFKRFVNGSLDESLVAILTICGSIRHAHHESLEGAKDSSYTECGREERVWNHLHVRREGVEPSARKFISLFKACSSLSDLTQGRKLHEEARKKGLMSDIYVGNTLLSMYGKCGAVSAAEDVFCSLLRRTIVSWNVMLSVYVQDFQGEKVLWAYRQMQEEGPSPNKRTLLLALQACGMLQGRQRTFLSDKQLIRNASFEIVQALHAAALKKGLARNSFIGNTLVSLYGKCGAVAQGTMTFNALPVHNVVSWTAMLSTYVENDQGEMGLHCYRQMQEEGSIPDKVSCMIAFQACGSIAEEEEAVLVKERLIKFKALGIGQALHADACGMNIASDIYVGTSIITMYGKCGATAEAEEAFHTLPHRDVVAWNAMLSVYIEQGDEGKALFLYNKMQEQHVPVDDVTLICALQACSEQGSLEVCEELHFDVACLEQGKLSSVLATLIHTYGNCGCMIGAKATFDGLVDPDLVSWSVLSAGYASEGNDTLTLQLFKRMQMTRILPDDVIFASVLTACSHAGLVCEGLQCFESMIRDYRAVPRLMHYGVMCDLFGRVGEFKRVYDMLKRMPMQADLGIWWFLLGACQTHGNIELAEEAFWNAINLQPKQTTAYILMSYVYAAAGLSNHVKVVENLRYNHGLCWSELD